MNTDSYYEIGHSHIVCEDYAMAGQVDNICFAIVSDGCSASKEVDIGARILAHSAKKYLTARIKDHTNHILPFSLPNISWSEFYSPVIFRARESADNLGLGEDALDCTLILALSDGVTTRVFAYGDGGIAVKYKNGFVEYFNIEFSSGAPYYMSYALDKVREEGYRNEFNQPVIVKDGKVTDGVIAENSAPRSYGIHDIYSNTSWRFLEVDFIAVMSDGINSYEKMDNKDKVSASKILTGMTNFKNLNGQFVERRMKSFKKECQKENIRHYDDISIASIHI